MGAKWNLKTIVDLLEEVTISRIPWNIPKNGHPSMEATRKRQTTRNLKERLKNLSVSLWQSEKEPALLS
jgi:hypothetical protein